MIKRTVVILITCLFCGFGIIAEEQNISDMEWKIRREGTERSQIMDLVHQLTDKYGPRLTGSPNFDAACDWSINRLREWGLQNEHVEKWDFGHPGWSCDKSIIRVLSPFKDTMDARVVAWTPGTKGAVRGEVIQITPPERPSLEELTAYLNGVKDRVKNKIVLVGAHTAVPIQFNPSHKRREDSELLIQYDPINPQPPVPHKSPEPQAESPRHLGTQEVDERLDSFLLENGALVRVMDSGRAHGEIRVFANRTYNLSKAVPSIVLRNEDYGRISRLLSDSVGVEMEIDILNSIHPEGQISRNVIAEIPGSDLKGQVVMIGAHIDSWHAGTGATDNASGVAAMMEAARILQKLGVNPRRTIRIALWGGEEQGLLGSKAYVRDHFGTAEAPKQEFSHLSAYINLDSGTGRVRGASAFGPPKTATVLRSILKHFTDLGVIGANSVNSRSYGGTDSTSFNWAGLPGINLSQDPIDYKTDTWHTSVDTYEEVLEEDLKQCAIVIASLAYHLAMQEEMLPRFRGDSMPQPWK